MLDALIEGLTTARPGELVVVPHLDLLAGGSDASLNAEARELADAVYEAADCVLPRAHLAFLDEVFQGSSAILNSLLMLMNERRFHNGSWTEQAGLLTLLGSTNDLPDDPVLAAFSDRFLLRVTIDYVDPDQVADLLIAGWRREIRATAGANGWREVPEGFRFDVDGGYAVYHPDSRELEAVAELRTQVSAGHEATTRVSGVVDETLQVEGEGRYYDDGWGGLTGATARRDAEQDAERRLQRAAADSVAEARAGAEAAAQEQTEATARARAETALAEATAAARADLDRTAAQRLEVIGARCREAFNGVLGMAYRDAILAYARSRRAHGVEVSQADAVAEGQRTADHDSVHDRVSTELAAVVERSTQIVEQPPHAQTGTGFLPTSPLPRTQQQTQQETPPPEALRD